MIIKWNVKGTGSDNRPFSISGLRETEKGEIHLSASLPEGTILEVSAEILVPLQKDEAIFMNGYQTWTYCPEYHKDDRIRGLNGLPQTVIDRFSLDRYGDYHFVDYPYQKGKFHGFSWCAFRHHEQIRLFASLDEDPGYTIFHYDVNTAVLRLTRDCAGIRCGGVYPLFDLYLDEGGEEEVFDNWFSRLPERRKAEKLFGYSSWYNRYQNISAETISSDLKGCRTLFEQGDLFQIDDGWEPFIGDWLEADTKKFPGGMKEQAEAIHAAGFEAGLWLAPFAAEEKSSLFQNHREWFIQVDGQPWKAGCNWSGFYGLNIDYPDVREYLKDVFHKVFDEWGFDLVKLDFLYAAAPYGSDTETRAARMKRAMAFLRELCGDKKILACGVPLMPAFGYVEYCRISCDVTLDWNDKPYMRIIHRERPSTKQAVANILSRRQLNGRAFLSDPDVFFLREENIHLGEEQKETLARLDALMGSVFLISDDPGSYTEEIRFKYAVYRHIALTAKNIRYLPEEGVVEYETDNAKRRLRL